MDGIINVYKEAGFTSFDVVAKLKRILKQKKIGHTGTLDPDAVGVLPVCVGKATKVCDMLTDRDKEYETVMRLGVTTDTLDMTGNIIRTANVDASENDIRNAINSFVGEIQQVPPMYSALKVNGKRLYELARAGIEIERKSREVTIKNIDILEINTQKGTVRMLVGCSKGTYIRSLCDDIGNKLTCGASMESLVRTKSGIFSIKDSLTLAQIEEYMQKDTLDSKVVRIEQLFEKYPVLIVNEESTRILMNGNKLLPHNFVEYKQVQKARVYDNQGNFIAVYQFDDEKDSYYPNKMFI